MKKLAYAALAAISLMVAGNAEAQQRFPAWYVGVSGNVNWVSDADFTGAGVQEAEYDTGTGIGIQLGYMPQTTNSFLANTRWELDFTYRNADIDSVRVAGRSLNIGDKVESLSYMANVFYDFENGTKWVPYIGAGIGGAEVQWSLNNANDSDTVFAYQGMLGISYRMELLPNTEWNVGYRYFATLDPEFDFGGARVEGEYETHNLEGGFRFRF